MAMTLLLPDPRPFMGLEQLQACLDDRGGVVFLRGLGRVELYAAEVLGADEAVLVGADQSGRRAMVAVERTPVEMFCDEHVVCQGVLDRHDGPVAVETFEYEMGDRRVCLKRRLDDPAVEG